METKKTKLQPIIYILITFLLVCFAFVTQLNINPIQAYAQDFEEFNEVQVLPYSNGTATLNLNSNQSVTLIQEDPFYFYFYCETTSTYCFNISYSNILVPLTIEITDNYGTSISYNLVVLPMIENASENYTLKVDLIVGRDYDIIVNYPFVGLPELQTIANISLWKSFDIIKINDMEIFNNNNSIDNKHIILGSTYNFTFGYNNNFQPSTINDNKWKLNDTTNASYVELLTSGNSFKVLNNSSNENKEIKIDFWDYEGYYTITLHIKRPVYAFADLDSITYDYNLLFKDSYGNDIETVNAGFVKMSIIVGDFEFPNITSYIYNIIRVPILESQTTVTGLVNFNIGNINYQQAITAIIINNYIINIADYNTETVTGDNKRVIVQGAVSNKTINVANSVTAIFFTENSCNKYQDFKINLKTQDACFLYLNGLKIKSTDTDTNTIESNASLLTININNVNVITGQADVALINCNNIEFEGPGCFIVIGNDGNDGQNGTSSDINGQSGTNGINALNCTDYDGLNQKIRFKGGNGGNGGDGYSRTDTDGLSGGRGGDGGNAGKGISSVGREDISNGIAGRGGNGGNGGNGANGNDAHVFPGGPFLGPSYQNAEAGKNGGAGGYAGKNGNGEFASSNMARGGNGGNGGKGGDGKQNLVIQSTNPTTGQVSYMNGFAYSAIGGHGGNGGTGYIGGNGGNGGSGGNGYNGANAILLGPSGSDGGNGSNGGNVGNGGYSWLNNSNAGGFGNGGNGGTGGSAGNGMFTSYSNGANGSSGTNGSNGSYTDPNQTPSCVATGTFITLADGTLKAVEALTGKEMLLVWNMMTGKFEFAPILFIDSDPQRIYEVINLYFSNGTSVKVISEHGFWNINLNKYVFLRNDATQYIGHWFNKQTTDGNGNMTWKAVQLTDVVIANELTTAWSPITYGYLCYYVNGMLSMPGATTGLINIFDVDAETMTIDLEAYLADIEEYGLFTYEEFNELLPVPEIIFEAFGGQNLKVSIGKGLITMEELASLIESYANFFDIA